MPVVFFGHGSPTNVLEDNAATRVWQEIGARMPKPKAILCISAHWFTRGLGVTAMAAPRTIHDFGPLDPRLFEIAYPAPGSPELAARVQALLAPEPVAADMDWGLDHGAWGVLIKAFPEADIPVVQLSLDGTKPGDWHYRLAQKLRPLRREGVLIAASGNYVHNLRVLEWNKAATPYDWAARFNDFVLDRIAARDHAPLVAYDTLGGDAEKSIPHPDHYLPLLYALGASEPGDEIAVESNYIEFKSLSMASLVFTPADREAA